MLFAIVLGLAAIATSFTRPPPGQGPGRGAPPDAGSTRSPTRLSGNGAPVDIAFPAAGSKKVRTLRVGQAATIVVGVSAAGQVELPGLGLSAPADRLTPARFDVLSERPDRYSVRVIPAGSGEARTVGELRIESPPER
jgi:hypothetical protein